MAFGKDTDPRVGKKTQFKPGESGNPDGKPKGAIHLSTHIQNLLNDEDFSAWVADPREGVKEFKGAPIKAIIKALMIKAINGDVKAFEALAKHGYGTKIDLSAEVSLKTALVEFVDGNEPGDR